MTDSSQPPQRTPQGDVQLARQALAGGDLAQAVLLLAGAFTADPANGEWLTLLDDVLAAAEAADVDLLSLAPEAGPDGEVWYGMGAVRARILQRLGRDAQAVAELCGVCIAQPGVPYMRWATAWLADDPALAAEVDPQAPLQLMLATLQLFPGAQTGNPQAAAIIGPMLPALDALQAAHPDAGLPALYATLLRKVGRFDDALAVAEEAFDRQPDYATCATIASIHREAGRVDHAISWYQRSEEFPAPPADPLAARLEAGDMLLEADRLAEAEAEYAAVVEAAPGHPWAQPSLLAVRFMRTRDDADRAAFLELVQAHPDNPRGRWLHGTLFEPVPWVDYLPAPQEESLQLVRELFEKWQELPRDARFDLPPADDFRVPTAWVQSPSLSLAWQMFSSETGMKNRLISLPQRVQTPDPRLPLPAAGDDVGFMLWTWPEPGAASEGLPEPAMAGPAAKGAYDMVGQVCAQRFHVESWARLASALAAGWVAPDTADDVGMQLAAAMANPPPLELRNRDLLPWLYIQRWQVAAALLIAYLDTGWHGSTRRRLLTTIARGPADWSVDAALLAMAWITRTDADCSEELAALLQELWTAHPLDGGPWVNRYAVACHLSQLPGLDPALAADVRAFRSSVETA